MGGGIGKRQQPVGRGPLQCIELSNCGGEAAPWRLDTASLQALQAANHGYPVLHIEPTEGILAEKSATFLHAYFTPIEARDILVPITVELLRDEVVIEKLEFQLYCQGYDPRFKSPEQLKLIGNAAPERCLKGESAAIQVRRETFEKLERNFVTDFYPASLPMQTYAPLPDAGCALSVEALDFGRMPLGAVQTKVVALVNYTTDQTLFYQWDDRNLFRGRNEVLNESEFQIVPQSGVLEPGSHQIVIFRFASVHGPVDVSGELECQVDWISSEQARDMERDFMRYQGGGMAGTLGRESPCHLILLCYSYFARFLYKYITKRSYDFD